MHLPLELPFCFGFLPAPPLLFLSLKSDHSLPLAGHKAITASPQPQPQLPLLQSGQCTTTISRARQERTSSMVKRLALSSLFFNSSETLSSSTSMSTASFSTAASWQWPSCTHARTLSFRRDSPEIVSMRQDDSSNKHYEEEEYKTSMNPAYGLDISSCSLLSDDISSVTLSTVPAVADDEDELIIHGLRSNTRLFFEPDSTSSIVNKKQRAATAFDGATALAIESANPYGDFRRSMEEMVLSHGVDDWGWLEEMLSWYLRANGKNTHGLIVGAFVDLLVALASSSSSSSFSQQSAHRLPAKEGHKQSDECAGPVRVCNLI